MWRGLSSRSGTSTGGVAGQVAWSPERFLRGLQPGRVGVPPRVATGAAGRATNAAGWAAPGRRGALVGEWKMLPSLAIEV